jgi:hypothetical protein
MLPDRTSDGNMRAWQLRHLRYAGIIDNLADDPKRFSLRRPQGRSNSLGDREDSEEQMKTAVRRRSTLAVTLALGAWA